MHRWTSLSCLFLILSFNLLSCTHIQKIKDQRLAIMQGMTNENSSQFSILVPKDKNYRYEILEKESQRKISFQSRRVGRTYSNWVVDKLTVTNLSTDKEYELNILNGHELVDQRFFTSLDLKQNRAKIAIASCMSDEDKLRPVMYKIWGELLAHRPNFIFLIGDNVYADMWVTSKIGPDGATPKIIWQRYVESRNLIPLFKTKKLIPILAIWDDHDYGRNNGGIEFKYKKESLQALNDFFAQETTDHLTKGPGASLSLKAFQQEYIFLDNRSFRTLDNSDIPDQSHWGPQQEEWLLQHLNTGTNPAWLINGDQIWGGYHQFESYEGNHKQSFKKMMKKISQANNPVIFITGDRHLAELMKITKKEFGYTTYELTTSGIHSHVFPNSWDKVPNHRQIAGAAEKYNYAIVTAEAKKRKLHLDVQVYGLGKELLFKRNLQISK